MPDTTHIYCGHCKRYVGTGRVLQCPHCGTVFNTSEDLGTITRTITQTTVDTSKLRYTIMATVGISFCSCLTAVTFSAISLEWAAFFSSLVTSFKWQLVITTIIFLFLFFALKILFGEMIDHLLTKLNQQRLYELFRNLRQSLAPFAQNIQTRNNVLMLIATVACLPILAKIFNRRLDEYDLYLALVPEIVIAVYTSAIEGIREQKQAIEREKNWTPPATLTEWKKMSQSTEP